MDRALTELAEATVGLNSELRWTLSEEIARRQVQPVFDRCARAELSPQQALDVCMDCMTAKLHATMKIFDRLYSRLVDKLIERYGDTHFPAMLEMQEFFMGLESTTTNWSTSEEMARAELAPMFERVASGNLSPQQGLAIFVDNMAAKRDYTLTVIQDMVVRLATEIRSEDTARENGHEVRVEDEGA
jgi:Asp-tRNA(Asn)/Glu-tRNA(Gln) amidotransferase B subunit